MTVLSQPLGERAERGRWPPVFRRHCQLHVLRFKRCRGRRAGQGLGWQGTAKHIFLQLRPEGGDCTIEGANDELSFDALPRSAPRLYNLTLVGGPMQSLQMGRTAVASFGAPVLRPRQGTRLSWVSLLVRSTFAIRRRP